jgi:hypothetical protein
MLGLFFDPPVPPSSILMSLLILSLTKTVVITVSFEVAAGEAAG